MAAFLRSLRFRIALAFVVWTAVIQVVVSTVLPIAREYIALKTIDARLAEPASKLVSEFEHADPFPPNLTDMTRDPTYQGWGEALFLCLRDETGAVIGASANLQGYPLPFRRPGVGRDPAFAIAAASDMPTVPSVEPELNRPARARVLTVRWRRPDTGKVYYLQAARSLVAVDRTRDAFFAILLVVSAASTVGAGVAGWIVAGRICARLDQIASSVRRISPTNLDERLDLTSQPDEIGRLATDVNVMLERLAEGFRSQERFISDVSHELKTPVAVLLTEAQALKMGRKGDAERKAFVLSVEDEMRRLGRLVESFLMLARFGHGRRFVGESLFAINDVALESIQHSSLLAAQHGISLALSLHDPGVDAEEARVRGDADLVRIAIDNLIRNAIQYSKRGDSVWVAVTCIDGHARVAVEDQGRGIPDQYLKTIFDRFAQAPGPTTSGRRGTGLGLSIAKGVVDLHHGTIDVRNRHEGGCAFTITLPLQHASSPGKIGANGQLAAASSGGTALDGT